MVMMQGMSTLAHKKENSLQITLTMGSF